MSDEKKIYSAAPPEVCGSSAEAEGSETGISRKHICSQESVELMVKLEEENERMQADAKFLVPRSCKHSTSSTSSTLSATSDQASGEGELMAKLCEANKIIEVANKLFRPLSRKNSNASIISSGSSSITTEDGRSSEMSDQDTWILWGRIVNCWETEWKKKKQYVMQLVRQGVPHHFRGIVWQLLSGADCSPAKQAYASYIKARSSCEKMIRRDIARTYPEHEFFKKKDGSGQEALFNVMKAYSIHDQEVGYCQGSGFIVGLLLMQMPEEDAFAVFVQIMQQHRMRDMFKPSMAELGLCLFQLEHLMQEMIPELYKHFQVQGFTTSIYASSWFLTLFATTFSLRLASRIMDVFLSEGIEIIFKVSLALLTLGKEDLLALDMENLLKFLNKDLPQRLDADHDMLMNTAYDIKVNSKRMKKLEKEYISMKTKEQGELADLRCLREENRILKMRVEVLEKESFSLAERLVRGQVDKAEGEEETFALATEMQALRRSYLEAQQRLSMAQDEIRSLEMTIVETRDCGEASAYTSEVAQCLQNELVRARLTFAEREAATRELSARLDALSAENAALKRQCADNSVAHLQDELIASKLREAEANLYLKELREKVNEVSECWEKYLQDHKQESNPTPPPQSNVVSDIISTPKKLLRAWEGRSADTQKMDEELMSVKIREAKAVGELKELRLKVMEMETEVRVANNRLARQEQEMRRLRDEVEAALKRERAHRAASAELRYRCSDLETKAKYETMQANIKNVEAAQRIAELENEISEYRLKNETTATEEELRGEAEENVIELQDQVSELTAEVMKLDSLLKQRDRRQADAASSGEPSPKLPFTSRQ